MSAIKSLIIYLLFVAPIMIFCTISIITGQATLFYNGFAVDDTGNIYIGKSSNIEEYHNGSYVKSINARTSRDYSFTIKDDCIILSTGTTIYTMDLSGKVISKKNDVNMETLNLLKNAKYSFTDSHENQYNMSSPFGRTKIIADNGQVLYQMPIFDYVVKLALFLTEISIIVFVPIIVKKWRKDSNKFTAR